MLIFYDMNTNSFIECVYLLTTTQRDLEVKTDYTVFKETKIQLALLLLILKFTLD